MAINFTTLTGAKTVEGSIARWVNRSDLPTDNILLEAEAWIYQSLRTNDMRSRTTFTIAEGAQTATLPADILEPISFTPYRWGEPLLYVHEQALVEQRDEDDALIEGTPSMWCIVGSLAYVDLQAVEDFVGILLYYARPSALSGSNETNFLTIKYPSLLRYACMAKAYEHMKEPASVQAYLQLAYGALDEAKRSADLLRNGQYMSVG